MGGHLTPSNTPPSSAHTRGDLTCTGRESGRLGHLRSVGQGTTGHGTKTKIHTHTSIPAEPDAPHPALQTHHLALAHSPGRPGLTASTEPRSEGNTSGGSGFVPPSSLRTGNTPQTGPCAPHPTLTHSYTPTSSHAPTPLSNTLIHTHAIHPQAPPDSQLAQPHYPPLPYPH